LSGKSRITRAVGAFECRIAKDNVVHENDLNLIERLYDSVGGFLVWLSGGDTAQLRTIRRGWRRQDLYFMAAENEYEPVFDDGRYTHGINVDLRLVEIA